MPTRFIWWYRGSSPENQFTQERECPWRRFTLSANHGQETFTCQNVQTQRFENKTIGIDISFFKQASGMHIVKLELTVEETALLITKLSNDLWRSL